MSWLEDSQLAEAADDVVVHIDQPISLECRLASTFLNHLHQGLADVLQHVDAVHGICKDELHTPSASASVPKPGVTDESASLRLGRLGPCRLQSLDVPVDQRTGGVPRSASSMARPGAYVLGLSAVRSVLHLLHHIRPHGHQVLHAAQDPSLARLQQASQRETV